MNDTSIESALEGAASRGVDVQVVMTYSSEWRTALENLRSAGVHVRVLPSSGLYIHAKVICADCASSDARVFIGSENFSVSSLVYNRELGVLSNFPSVVHDVRSVVLSDYAMGSSNF
jgi:phosphatidylserine/phosphatidylglycerophosphate/cardiolipin synthase-like enzyme